MPVQGCTLPIPFTYPMQWMRLMVICCGKAVKRMGMSGSECEEDEGTDCENGDSHTD